MSDQKEMSSTSELISQFEEAIRSSTERINNFVRRNNEGWTQVNTLTEQLKGLIDQLRSCLERLIGLKDFYLEFLGRLRTLKGRQEERLSGEIRKLEQSGNEECRNQIQGLITQFRTFISSFNQLEVGTTAQLQEQVQRLDTEIKRLCNDTDGIIKLMENNRGDMDSVFGAASSGSEGEDGSRNTEVKQPASQMRRPVRGNVSGNVSGNLQDRPPWRGGFQYGKKLSRKKKIRSLSNLKKKKRKSIFNTKKKRKKRNKSRRKKK